MPPLFEEHRKNKAGRYRKPDIVSLFVRQTKSSGFSLLRKLWRLVTHFITSSLRMSAPSPFSSFAERAIRRLESPQRKSQSQSTHFKVHVWAGISRNGATKICSFDGIMEAQLYCSILESFLLPFLHDKLPDHRFMQDNDPKHTSRRAKAFFEVKNINWWPTPPESPDLNPIEDLWHGLKFYLEFNYHEWSKLSKSSTCRFHIRYCAKVMQNVILANFRAKFRKISCEKFDCQMIFRAKFQGNIARKYIPCKPLGGKNAKRVKCSLLDKRLFIKVSMVRCSSLVIFLCKEKFFVWHASASHLRDVYFQSVLKTLWKK